METVFSGYNGIPRLTTVKGEKDGEKEKESPTLAKPPRRRYSSYDREISPPLSPSQRSQRSNSIRAHGRSKDGVVSPSSPRLSLSLSHPPPPPQGAGGRLDWNEMFQAILEEVDESRDMRSYEEKYRQLAQLAVDFVAVSKTYAKLIISELFLPEEEKTIKPRHLGGMAGGVKYRENGIYFKLALDKKVAGPDQRTHYIYGGNKYNHEYAAKAAGHVRLSLSFFLFIVFICFSPSFAFSSCLSLSPLLSLSILYYHLPSLSHLPTYIHRT